MYHFENETLFFFFLNWNKKNWVFLKKSLGSSMVLVQIFFFFFKFFSFFFFLGKDLEILIFFFFCLFYFGNGQNETKKSVKMHQSWNLLTNKKLKISTKKNNPAQQFVELNLGKVWLTSGWRWSDNFFIN